MLRHGSLLTLAVACAAAPRPASACTNILITPGASKDGSTMITYSADSHELYGELYLYPARRHRRGAMRRIIDWDTGKPRGQIREARRTYQVVGNINEHQVVIGETTFGGREELTNDKSGVDYGSLMYIALQRARTAREAIRIITSLAAEHGYASGGESFSIGDPKEVWLLELIGKGKAEKGAVWVARRVPDGQVTAHSNYPRIRSFPRDDPERCIYSRDVISFARRRGYFKGRDRDFSFSDVYAPRTFKKLRISEARTWSVLRRVAPSLGLSAEEYILGKDPKRLPLWVKPDRKLSVKDVMALMRDHYDGTPLDLRNDVGAGPFRLPYRWRPLTWKVDGKTYFNERAISTQQTGFSFVTQSRGWLPGAIGGVIWFGVDDTASTVYVPMYAGIRRVPRAYAVGTADFKRFSWDSAFWIFNWVSNFAYSRYADMIKDIRKVQVELEGRFLADQAAVERKALALHRRSPAQARAFLTRYSVQQGQTVARRWRRLGEELLVKYLDGNVRDDEGKVTHPDYPEAWRRRVVKDRGAHLRLRRLPGEPGKKRR
jgi:dipeptidase